MAAGNLDEPRVICGVVVPVIVRRIDHFNDSARSELALGRGHDAASRQSRSLPVVLGHRADFVDAARLRACRRVGPSGVAFTEHVDFTDWISRRTSAGRDAPPTASVPGPAWRRSTSRVTWPTGALPGRVSGSADPVRHRSRRAASLPRRCRRRAVRRELRACARQPARNRSRRHAQGSAAHFSPPSIPMS